MKSMKFLLMFVLMLSIASVNVDAQRRRSYSRSRSRTTTTQANRQTQPVEQFDLNKEIDRICDRAQSANNISAILCNLICPGDDVRAIKAYSLGSQKKFYDTGFQFVVNLESSNGSYEVYEIEWTFINQNYYLRRPSEFTVINNKVNRVWYTE